MSRTTVRRERLGWLLTGIVASVYVIFVAALSFLPRHQPELLADGGTFTFAMGATLIFIAALVVVTSFYLHDSRGQPDGSEQAAAREHRP